jgi:hypothetical protein
MDAATLERYHEAVKKVIDYYAQFVPAHGVVTNEVINVPEKGHYSLIHVGWHGDQRIHGMVIHIDIIDDKIWIQYDGTEIGVATDLVEAGIPRESIVLGFYPASIRPLTDFAIGD